MFAIADVLLRMRLRTKPYEVKKGETVELLKNLVDELKETIYNQPPTKKILQEFLRYAVDSFNAIDVHYDKPFSKVGIVGEIYLKTNCFSNNYLIDWLEERNREVVLPPMLDFFEHDRYTDAFERQEDINKRPPLKRILRRLYHQSISHYKNLAEKELQRFDRYEHEMTLQEATESIEAPMPLYLIFGEGWLLPMEIAQMSKDGVKDIISVQPFGCISNHIVAKGAYRRLKDEYDINMLLLDYESGTSEVNNTNRLELFLNSSEN